MRLFLLLLRVAVLIALVVFFAAQPGTARLVWFDHIIETSAAFLALVVAALAVGLFLLHRAWRFFREGPRYWRLRRNLKKLHDGQALLTHGFVALAAGDATEAGRLAVAARKALGATTLTRLLQAQAAQLAEDHSAARELFLELAENEESAVLGYRGLIMQALRTGDWAEVERQVEALQDVRPDTSWLATMRFEIAARRGDWREAGAALEQAEKGQGGNTETFHRYRATALLAEAQEAALQGRAEQALQAAEKAARHAPDWLPALLVLAQQQISLRHERAARRTLGKAWARAPHPQFAELCRNLERGDKPLESYKAVERLTRANPEHPASRLALAEAALAADLWGEARKHLIALVSRKEATPAAYRLFARLERREAGDETAATRWLALASDAPPDPTWLCTACGGASATWQPVCKDCGTFATFEWGVPGVSRGGQRGEIFLTAGKEELPFSSSLLSRSFLEASSR